MRLKRLCEPTKTGKLQVAPDVNQQWMTGCREELSLALVKALKQHGFSADKKTRDKVRAGIVA